jgi:SAM-dependent methyltransferase
LRPREDDRVQPSDPYYRRDLALVHHRGFGLHAEACAPGILKLLEPIRRRDGLVLELGCGSGLLTKDLVNAGYRVVATDASPAMLELTREHAPGAEDIRQLVLPHDSIPQADAIVSVGHALSYLPDEAAVDRALVATAQGLRPGGLFALDICDLEWGEARRVAPNLGRVGEDWAIITEFSVPAPNKFVRDVTTFVRNEDGSWRRDDERHENVLIDTSQVPGLLDEQGVDATVGASFGSEQLPAGLRVVIGRRRA